MGYVWYLIGKCVFDVRFTPHDVHATTYETGKELSRRFSCRRGDWARRLGSGGQLGSRSAAGPVRFRVRLAICNFVQRGSTAMSEKAPGPQVRA